MQCPRCGSEKHRVYDTRNIGNTIVRRRICESDDPNDRTCGFRFITYETIGEVFLYEAASHKEKIIPVDEYKKKYFAADIDVRNQTQMFEG